MIDLFTLIQRLKENRIFFELSSHRESFVMLTISVPGERWEIELSNDGELEIEIFKSDGTIHSTPKLTELFSRFSDSNDDIPDPPPRTEPPSDA